MKYNIEEHGPGWRGNLINYFALRDNILQFGANKPIFTNGAVYQFGVWNGFSLQSLSKIFQVLQYNVQYYGFDVFTGMPVEEAEPDKQIDLPGWYNILEHFGVDNLEDALKGLEEDVRSNMGDKPKLTFIPGLVQETLTSKLARTLVPASYVDVDMDIYSPTNFALDFLFKHNLIVEGTIIGYDDWGQNYPESDTYTCGESKAHKEVFEKYGAKCIQLMETEERGQTAFLVTEVK